ncbi:rhodanese-like domain-containing protein [Myxococcus landrumensis]|uniref:Rhodanese-like domain-containing protein n=1 Tax=Myxococcus landrumensis TaxID=2813577 RepID=A0ABX7NEZ4_9BACT|nr:rhodanese-like domain-containing protein [Myxococcus landrumus]QSQ16180.1 rhodanese-like domain-containing protein [Myxococcus landrumus]
MEPNILCTELYLRLGDDELLVIDCRTPAEWEHHALHIPGALRMSPGEVALEHRMLPDDELIVLCGGAQDGSDVRRVCRLLRMHGREAVCLEGGLPAWIRGGYPTERHARPQLALPR